MKKLLLISLLLCTGCASIFRGTKQGVWFTTDPPGATVKVAWVEGVTPCMLPFDRSSKTHTATISKEGYQKREVVVSPEFEGTKLVAELMLSLFGVLMDLGSGAFYQYPYGVQLKLNKQGEDINDVMIVTRIPPTPKDIAIADEKKEMEEKYGPREDSGRFHLQR